VLDVDGVLTDGRVVYAGELEISSFHVRDGAALAWLRGGPVRVAWISGRGCEATERRARELDVSELHLHVREKGPCLEALQARLGVSRDETVAMGDDLADLSLAVRAGFFAAPADACAAVRERADLVTRARGGQGAVRELVELLLTAQGRWRAILDAAAR